MLFPGSVGVPAPVIFLYYLIDNHVESYRMIHNDMIDPKKVTKFDRTVAELEEFLLFAIVVAGKNAFIQAKKLEDFLNCDPSHELPFTKIRRMHLLGQLENNLRLVKMGQYERISTAFRGVAFYLKAIPRLNSTHETPLWATPVQLLESIKGIGMKTARFFVMHTRLGQDYACLDTHVLRWLGSKGHEVPKMTPRGQKYIDLEKIFLDYCKQMNKMPAELDLEIWNQQHE